MEVDDPAVQLCHDSETKRFLVLLVEDRLSVVPGSA
jgi:hypothetical protein